MKTTAFLSLFVLVAGCGGTWSNKDLEFLNALPTREQLESKVPSGKSTGLTGVGTRQDPLSVGEPSKVYSDTKGASNSFNGLLKFVIDIIEAVRQVPPTTREIDSRTWGPFKDDKNPGFEVQVVITQVTQAKFTFAFQERKIGGAFFDTVSGEFNATPDLHQGTGMMIIHAKDVTANLKNSSDLAAFDAIRIDYQTEMFPKEVDVAITPAAGQPNTLGSRYREQKNGSGEINFAVTNTASTEVAGYLVVSRWLVSGAGGALVTVTAGTYKDFTQTECWDEFFNTTYAKQSWPGGMEIGNVKDCVTVDGF